MTPHHSPSGPRAGLETRLAAAGNDTDQILLALNTEIALRRAGRKFGGSHQVYASRALSIAMLLFLIVGTCGALIYLRSQFGERPPRPTPAVISSDPAPGPSAPAVAPSRQSVPPTR